MKRTIANHIRKTARDMEQTKSDLVGLPVAARCKDLLVTSGFAPSHQAASIGAGGFVFFLQIPAD
jgi:hypothetical protein